MYISIRNDHYLELATEHLLYRVMPFTTFCRMW